MLTRKNFLVKGNEKIKYNLFQRHLAEFEKWKLSLKHDLKSWLSHPCFDGMGCFVIYDFYNNHTDNHGLLCSDYIYISNKETMKMYLYKNDNDIDALIEEIKKDMNDYFMLNRSFEDDCTMKKVMEMKKLHKIKEDF